MKSENKVSFKVGKLLDKIEVLYNSFEKIIETNEVRMKKIYIKITLVHQAGYSAFPHLPAAPELIAAKVWPSISPSLFVFPLMYKGPPSSPLHGPYKNQIKNQTKSYQIKLINGITDHKVVRTYCVNICLVVINSLCT